MRNMFLVLCILFVNQVHAQHFKEYIDFYPCFHSRIEKCSIMNFNLDTTIIKQGKKLIKYIFKKSSNSLVINLEVFDANQNCIQKGQFIQSSVDTIKVVNIVLSGGVQEHSVGLRRGFTKEGTWFQLYNGKLKISYFKKGKIIRDKIPLTPERACSRLLPIYLVRKPVASWWYSLKSIWHRESSNILAPVGSRKRQAPHTCARRPHRD